MEASAVQDELIQAVEKVKGTFRPTEFKFRPIFQIPMTGNENCDYGGGENQSPGPADSFSDCHVGEHPSEPQRADWMGESSERTYKNGRHPVPALRLLP